MFLFTMFSDLGDIIQRGRDHQPLTPGEAALLRLFDGLTVAALLAGWAAFQEYGPHIPALTGAAGAVFAALGLAWQQWAAHGGLAAVQGGAPDTTAPVPAPVTTAAEFPDLPEMPPMPDAPTQAQAQAQASGGVPTGPLPPLGPASRLGAPRGGRVPLSRAMRERLFAMDPDASGFLLDSQPQHAATAPPLARGTLADMPPGGLVRDPEEIDLAATAPVPAVHAPDVADGPLARTTRPVPAVGAEG
jgi:hypothetical protein